MYLKWKLVQEYLKENNITDAKTIKTIKDVININKNNDFIKYDNTTHKITEMDIESIK